jgi:hypothetical protein
MKKCNILVLGKGQEVAATFVLEAGTVTGSGADKEVLEGIMDTPNIVGDQIFTLKDNPEEWFNSLPQQYSGSYCRAQMVLE